MPLVRVSNGGTDFPKLKWLQKSGSSCGIFIPNEEFTKYEKIVVTTGSAYVILFRSNSVALSGTELKGRGLTNQTWTYTFTDTDRTYAYIWLNGAASSAQFYLE